jgi:hypothetical protein
MTKQDVESLSPTDLGRVLALTLDKTCTIEQISEQERSILAEAKIRVEKYHGERLLLAAFAGDYAITTLLRNSPARKEVRDGYLEAWNNVGLFFQRCQEYAKAAERVAPGTMNPVGLAFSGFLESTHIKMQMLALTHGSDLLFSHFEIVAELLAQAKLIKRPGN